MLQRILSLGAIALIALSFTTQRRAEAQTPTPISACGNISGSVILSTDLTIDNQSCLNITSNNTTIDGNGHRITITNGLYRHAVQNIGHAHLTVRNLSSNSEVYISGDAADNALIENNNLGGVSIDAADDITIQNNTLATASIGVKGVENEAQRATFINNTVHGDAKKLMILSGGVVPCDATQHTIRNNTFTNTHVCPTPQTDANCDEPMIMFVWCSSGNTIDHNTLTGTAFAQGMRFRDESSYNAVTNNTVRIENPYKDFGALNITSGNLGTRDPWGNTFSYNTFFSNGDTALKLQGTGGNSYDHNVFATTSGAGSIVILDDAAGDVFDRNTIYNASGPAIMVDAIAGTMNTFTNNIISSGSGNAIAHDSSWSFARYTGNNNLWYSINAATMSSRLGSFTNWQAASGNTDDMDSRFGNPLFINANNNDFHLQSSSAARGVGSGGTDAGAFSASGPPSCVENWSCEPWAACTGGTQTRTCIDAQACGTTTTRPPLLQNCDGAAPTITLTAPENNATVSGTLTIMATANDNVGVAGVQFKLDGQPLGSEDVAAPYDASWDTTATTNGIHVLTAVARDTTGNVTTSSIATVTVTGATAAPTSSPLSPSLSSGASRSAATPSLFNPIACRSVACLVSQAIRYILSALAVVAVGVFIWGGGMMLMSGGNADQVQKAKSTLVWAALGLILIIGSWTLVRAVLDGLLKSTS